MVLRFGGVVKQPAETSFPPQAVEGLRCPQVRGHADVLWPDRAWEGSELPLAASWNQTPQPTPF